MTTKTLVRLHGSLGFEADMQAVSLFCFVSFFVFFFVFLLFFFLFFFSRLDDYFSIV